MTVENKLFYRTRKGNILTVEGETRVKGRRKLLVSCDVCSKDLELYKGLFITNQTSLNRGRIPCGCSGHFKYNEDQAAVISKRRCEQVGKVFYGFSGCFSNISNTKVKGYCLVHDNPTWDNIFNYLKNDKECPQCSRKGLVFGVGVNDSKSITDGCPFYGIWHGVLKRCYSEKFHKRNPAYRGCTIHPDWVYFSNFKSWMEKQDWVGKELDKDLLVYGNKMYSADTCIFISRRVNCFIKAETGIKRKLSRGVTKNKSGKYDCYLGGRSSGNFNTEEEAHLAWQLHKIKTAEALMEGQCNKVKEKLMSIRDNILSDIANNRPTEKF